MAQTKLKNAQLPDVIQSKTIDTSNDIDTTTTKLTITGGTNGQVLSTDGASNLSWITAGGGVSDGDKGDITVASSGTVWTIDNDAVTYAKMQNVSAVSRILGRGSAAGSGDVQELTVGSGLTINGTAVQVGNTSITNAMIANDAVTYAKIQNVTTSRLLGRASTGSGDVEEITIGTGLSFTGTQIFATGGGASNPDILLIKSADETVTSSTVLQDDDHLTTTLDANSYYYGELDLLVTRTNTSNSPQLKFAILADNFSGTNGTFKEDSSTTRTNMDGSASATSGPITLSTQVPYVMRIVFAIKTPSTTVPLTFRFAQQTSSTTGITVMKGSTLKAWKRATV